MSLIKFRNRSPFANLVASDFFNMEDFFENQLGNKLSMADRFWNGNNTEPALNIKETEDHFEIELASPGFSKKDFNITVDDGCLNISAEKSSTDETKDENYTRKEFSYNAFERTLQLPKSVKEEAIKASYKDGILSFNLAKKEEAKKKQPKVIAIS